MKTIPLATLLGHAAPELARPAAPPPADPPGAAPRDGEPPGLPAYAELHCESNFSFLRGASWPEELVERAKELNYAAIAITDECSMAGAPRAWQAAEKHGLTLLIGSSFRLAGGPAPTLVALARNREGYGNLCEMITLGRLRAAKGSYLLTPDDFAAPAGPNAHLRGLPDCSVLLAAEYGVTTAQLDAQLAWAVPVFGERLWLALTLHRQAHDDRHRAIVLEAAARHGVPVVATGRVQMHMNARKQLHDTMTAIRVGRPVSQCGYELAGNAQAHLRPRVDLARLYSAEAMEESFRIAENCLFRLSELKYEYPDEIVPPGHTPASFLREQTLAGAEERFPHGTPPKVAEQIEKELALIAELAYEAYFLTVHDIVRFARSRGILCQGRGSAANSAVCYCLHITEVDPARGNSLFERFISKERDEPPDIDVDFEHQRREEVIQYIYAKYGTERAALTAVAIGYRPRSVLRDTGKALGIDLGIIDAVAKSHHYWDGRGALVERLVAGGLDPDSRVAQQWARLAGELMNFPRHLSQHPGGFVISRGKLSRLVPIENAAMVDRRVVQWDKDDLESLGLMKVDVLALGMLSVVRRAMEFVSLRRGHPFRAQDIPARNTPTFDMICAADTIGTFQIESRAQMSMLPRLRPRQYYDLVVQVAIVRPGPIQGGMVHPFLRRRQGLEPIDYPKGLETALDRTMGVPIFQEQVMQIAILAAGFTPGEADQLRRSMAAWKRKGGLGHYYDKIVNGMTQRGYDQAFAEQIFAQIQGFGEYGFPESHAAGFALIAYLSAWLKRHEPEAFLAALLNSQPMGFYSPSTLVQDARRHRVAVRPVDVMHSDWESTLEHADAARRLLPGDACPRDEQDDQEAFDDTGSPEGQARGQRVHAPTGRRRPAVRLGMSLIKGFDEAAAGRIAAARGERAFADTADLALRAGLSRAHLQALADANALFQLAGHRRQALWHAVADEPGRGLLRPAAIQETEHPELAAPTEGESLVSDYRALSLSLGRHPLALLRPRLAERRFSTAAQLHDQPTGRLVRACGIVTVRQRPGTSKAIFVTLEDETGVVNVIVKPRLIDSQRQPLLASTLMGVYGTWQNESDVRHLVAGRLVDLSSLLGDLATHSRNFH